jgi:hypothetical protein
MFRGVVGLSDQLVLSVKDVVNGRVDVEQLASRYVILRGVFSLVKNMARAANLMVKSGWRVVGWSSGYLMLERNDS